MSTAITVEVTSQSVLQALAALAARFKPSGMRSVMKDIGEERLALKVEGMVNLQLEIFNP